MRQNKQYLFNVSYLEVFGVLTRVGVDVSKFFGVGVGAGVLQRGAGVESESEKGDSVHLWCEPTLFVTQTFQNCVKMTLTRLIDCYSSRVIR